MMMTKRNHSPKQRRKKTDKDPLNNDNNHARRRGMSTRSERSLRSSFRKRSTRTSPTSVITTTVSEEEDDDETAHPPQFDDDSLNKKRKRSVTIRETFLVTPVPRKVRGNKGQRLSRAVTPKAMNFTPYRTRSHGAVVNPPPTATTSATTPTDSVQKLRIVMAGATFESTGGGDDDYFDGYQESGVWRVMGEGLVTEEEQSIETALERYTILANNGVCLPVNFGTTVQTAKRAIVRKLRAIETQLAREEEHVDLITEAKEYKRSLRVFTNREAHERLERQKEDEAVDAMMAQQLYSRRVNKAKDREMEVLTSRPIMFERNKRTTRCSASIKECQGCELCLRLTFDTTVSIDKLCPRFRRLRSMHVTSPKSMLHSTAVALYELEHSVRFIEQHLNIEEVN